MTKRDIGTYLAQALRDECSHLMIVSDSFSHEYYPVYVKPGQIKSKVNHYNKASMQFIKEIYDLSLDIETQLNEVKAYHI